MSEGGTTTCPFCDGTGQVPAEVWRCWYCGTNNDGWRRICRGYKGGGRACRMTRDEDRAVRARLTEARQ